MAVAVAALRVVLMGRPAGLLRGAGFLDPICAAVLLGPARPSPAAHVLSPAKRPATDTTLVAISAVQSPLSVPAAPLGE